MDQMEKILKIPGIFNRILAKPIIWLIYFYQKTISPDHGQHAKNNPFCGCKFYPTCSQYAVEVLKKNGLFPGIFRVIWRIFRCNPWNKGGIDEA